jgi:SAM-dependent methyltransferase
MDFHLFSQELIKRINEIELSTQKEENEIRQMFVDYLKPSDSVLDCGKSLREYFSHAQKKCREIVTIDINRFGDYPDYVVDICDPTEMKEFDERFDAISCFSLLEHCYQPFLACDNLFNSLKPGGKIIGSAPFLFPRHSPEDLSYQDYFRFTRDAYAILFPRAEHIKLFPLRGRVTTSLNVLTTRYRFTLERYLPSLTRSLNRIASEGKSSLQSSGYGFIVTKAH